MPIAIPSKADKKALVKPSRGQARFAFSILLIINILNYADRYVLPAVLPKIQYDFGLTPFQEGLLGSSFLFVYAIATLPIGVWADRSVRKNIVALCVGIWSVATALTGFTRNFLQLFSVRTVLGIGEAGYAPASLSLLGDYFSKARRARILSLWSAGQLIGSAIGLTVGGLIADAFGWRYAFLIVGVPGLIAAFLAWRMIEPTRGAFDNGAFDNNEEDNIGEEVAANAQASIGKNFWADITKLRQIPTYWVLVVALVFSFFTIGGTSFWLPSYVVNTFHLSVSSAGIISGGVLVGSGLVGTIAGGWLADFVQRRRPEGRLLTAAFGFLVGTPFVLIALLMHNLPFFIAMFAVGGIFLSFCLGPLNAVLQDIISPGMRATALGLSLLLAHLLGDAAAPTVIGAIANTYSLFFALIITTPLCLFLAGLVCLLGLRTVARDMQRMQKQIPGQDRWQKPIVPPTMP
jgi:MFS transporter, Spinster family, sphingosine-1-phosphate transporter